VRTYVLVGLVVGLLALGCNRNPQTVPVTGTVTYQGKPLATGTIIFESPGSRPATGKIVDGQITEVTTFEPGDGAPPGKHAIAIQSIAETSSAVAADPSAKTSAGYMQATSLLPDKYGAPSTSGLSADIQAGMGPLKFELE
jgi:hypothetical protein